MTPRPPVLLLGIGGVLMGDDGIGPYTIALIAAGWRLTDEVELLDAGTPGLDLVTHLSGRRVAVILDAVRADAAPGTIRVYTKADIVGNAAGLRAGQHEPALRDTLLSLALSGEDPGEVVLVGVVPADVRTRTGLSPVVRAAAPLAAAEAMRQLEAFGVRCEACVPPEVPDVWWERGAPSSQSAEAQ